MSKADQFKELRAWSRKYEEASKAKPSGKQPRHIDIEAFRRDIMSAGKPAPKKQESEPTKKYTGYILVGDILYLFESAEDLRVMMMKLGRSWSSVGWIEGTVCHEKKETK